jgi:hypothetical protein
MPLMRCPECREQVSSQAISCPHCGYPIEGEDDGDARLSRISILAILVFLLAIMATWGTIFFPGTLAAILEELANLVIAIANLLR